MLTLLDGPCVPGIPVSRREILRVGGLALGGLTLADVFRGRAGRSCAASESVRRKSVILIWLRGGPSHIDSFDMKSHAPAEIRGEFQPIPTAVPGIEVCEYLPRVASIMDKLAIVRGIRSNDLGDHTPHYIVTGCPDRGKRPAFGSVVSRLLPAAGGMPRYASLMYEPPGLYDNEGPVFLGPSHRPFVPRETGLENLSLARGVTSGQLAERRTLLTTLDGWARRLGDDETMAGLDAHRRQAFEMIVSPRVREAFDLKRESPEARDRYGKFCESFLMARRLAEAGVSVVTLRVGDWDTHEKNFRDMRDQLPQLDRGFHALVSDLHERGLEEDVAVVMWGEFGRAPRISRGDGRDHWPEAGAAVLAGGGFRTGQAIGATDAQGGRATGAPYTPGHVLATLYRHLGLDPARTLPDRSGRPIPLLDDQSPIAELGPIRC